MNKPHIITFLAWGPLFFECRTFFFFLFHWFVLSRWFVWRWPFILHCCAVPTFSNASGYTTLFFFLNYQKLSMFLIQSSVERHTWSLAFSESCTVTLEDILCWIHIWIFGNSNPRRVFLVDIFDFFDIYKLKGPFFPQAPMLSDLLLFTFTIRPSFLALYENHIVLYTTRVK